MSEPFMTELQIFSFNFPPRGWAFANGQLMPINQNQALFALLGTTFGGNGQTNFALPDLKNRIAIHQGNGHSVGEAAGLASVTINIQQLPTHLHAMMASDTPGNVPVPGGNVLAKSPSMIYSAPTSLTTLHPSSVTSVGGSQPHSNEQPYLVLSCCIALQGVFPSFD